MAEGGRKLFDDFSGIEDIDMDDSSWKYKIKFDDENKPSLTKSAVGSKFSTPKVRFSERKLDQKSDSDSTYKKDFENSGHYELYPESDKRSRAMDLEFPSLTRRLEDRLPSPVNRGSISDRSLHSDLSRGNNSIDIGHRPLPSLSSLIDNMHISSPPTRQRTRDRSPQSNIPLRGYRDPDRFTPRRASHQNLQRREKEPDKFDGRSSMWRDYIIQFEQAASWNGWTYSEMAQQLCMSLRGAAQRLVADLTVDQRQDYSELKRVLEQRFNPKERSSAYKTEFKTRRRLRGETPEDYGYALRRLGSLAYPHRQYDAREENIVDRFIEGVGDKEIGKHIQFNHPETLDEAIAYAIEYEAFDKAFEAGPVKPKPETEQDRVHSLKPVRPSIKAPSKEETEKERKSAIQNVENQKMNSMLKEFEKLCSEIKVERESIENIYRDIKQEREHIERLSNSNRGVSNQGYRAPGCFKCGKTDHFIASCPLNKNQGN